MNLLNIIKGGTAALLCAAALNANAVGPGNLGTVSPPFTANYGNTFSVNGLSFLDDYIFTLSPAGSFTTISATINLGSFFDINGLQARLYAGSGPFAPGVTPLIQKWSTAMSYAPGVTGETVVINPVSLAAGTYTLELRGTTTGTFGGSYAGVLNISPVPEPGNYALLLAGLGMTGFVAARRKQS